MSHRFTTSFLESLRLGITRSKRSGNLLWIESRCEPEIFRTRNPIVSTTDSCCRQHYRYHQTANLPALAPPVPLLCFCEQSNRALRLTARLILVAAFSLKGEPITWRFRLEPL